MNTNELNASAASKSFECQQNPPSLISLISYPKVSEVSLPNSFDDDDDHLHFHQRNIENNNDQSNAVVPGKQDIVINNKLGLFYNHRQNTDKFYHHHRHHVSEQYNQEKDYAKLPEFYESSGNNVRRDNANYSPPLSRLRSRADDLLLLPRLVDDNSELLPISLSGGCGVASDPLTSYDYSKYRYFYRDINSSDVTGPAAAPLLAYNMKTGVGGGDKESDMTKMANTITPESSDKHTSPMSSYNLPAPHSWYNPHKRQSFRRHAVDEGPEEDVFRHHVDRDAEILQRSLYYHHPFSPPPLLPLMPPSPFYTQISSSSADYTDHLLHRYLKNNKSHHQTPFTPYFFGGGDREVFYEDDDVVTSTTPTTNFPAQKITGMNMEKVIIAVADNAPSSFPVSATATAGILPLDEQRAFELSTRPFIPPITPPRSSLQTSSVVVVSPDNLSCSSTSSVSSAAVFHVFSSASSSSAAFLNSSFSSGWFPPPSSSSHISLFSSVADFMTNHEINLLPVTTSTIDSYYSNNTNILPLEDSTTSHFNGYVSNIISSPPVPIVPLTFSTVSSADVIATTTYYCTPSAVRRFVGPAASGAFMDQQQAYLSSAKFLHDAATPPLQALPTLERYHCNFLSSGSSELLSKMYDTALEKYEHMKQDYDLLRKKFTDLSSSYDTTLLRVERESLKIRAKLDAALDERSQLLRENFSLKQHLTFVTRRLELFEHEAKENVEHARRTGLQRDEAIKEMNHALALQIKSSKDLERRLLERNAAVQEYNLVMAERDTVHREIDKLNEELIEVKSKLTETVDALNAKTERMGQLESDRSLLSHEYDKLREEFHFFRAEYETVVSERDQLRINLQDFVSQSAKLVEERDALKQDKIMALEDRDTLFKEFYHKDKSSYADRESLYERLWTVQSDFLDTKKELDEAREQLQICAKRWDALVIEHDKIQGFSSRLKLLCDQLLERYGIDGMFCAESSHRGNPTRTAMENLIPFSDWSPSFTAAATFTNGLGVERLRRSPEWQMEILEVHRSFVDSGAISLDSGITFAPPPPPADPSITLGDYHHLNFGLRVTAVASESVFEGNIFGEDLIVAVGDTVISTNKDFDKLLRESLESGHGKTRLTLMRIHRSGNNNANVKSRLPYEYLYTRLDCNNSPPSSYLNGNNYKSFKPRPLNRRHSHLFKFKTIGTYPPRRRRRRLLDIVFPNTFINTTTTTTTTNNNNKKTSSMGRYLMNSSYPKRNPLPIHWMMKEGYSSNHHPHHPRFLDSFQLTSLLSRTGGETLLSYAFSEHGTTFAASAPHRSSTRTYRETIRESNLNHRPVISDGGNGGERHDVLHSNDDNNNSATLNSRKKRGKLSMKFEAYLDKFQEKILKKLTATNGKSSKRFNQLLNESFDSSFNSHKEESSELAPEKTKNKKYATKDRETNKPGVSFRPFTPKHRNLSPTERDTLAALDDVIGSYGGTKVDGGGGTRTTSSSNEYLEESSSNATTGAATFAAAASMDVSSTNSSILDAHFGTDTNEVIIDMKHDTSTPPYDRSHDATNNGHGRRTNSGFTHYDEMTLNDAFNCQQHQQHGGSVKRKIVLSRREHHSNTFNNISLPRAGQQDAITFLPEFRATPTGLPEAENTNHPENVFSPPSFLGSIHVSTPLDLEDEDCVGSARSPPPPPRLSRPYNTVKSLISHYQQRQHNKIPISPPFTFENTWWPRKRGKERCSLFTSVFGSTDTDFSAQQPRSGSFIINGNRRGRKSHLNFPNATNSPAFSLLDYYEGNDGKTSNTTNTVSTSTDQSLLNSITSTAETSSLLPDGSRLVNFNCANNAQNQSCNKTSTPFMATLIRKRHKKTAGCTTITSDPSTKHYRYSAYYGGSIRPKISPLEDQFFVNIGSLDCLKSSAKSKVQPPTDKTKNQTQNVLNNDQELSSNFIDYSMEKNYEHSSNQFKKASKLEFTSLLNKVRSINIDKSTEPLGIKIVCITNNPNDNLKVNFYDSGDIHKGGIYVSSIEENSLAFLAGLQVGDQLLEICGINLRNATYSLAANVLRNCGQQMTILAQYNPTKYYSAMISLNVYEANDGSTNLTSLDKTVPTLNERHSYTDEYTTHSDLNFKSKCTDKNDGLKYEPSATVKVSKRSGTRKCNITNFEQLFLHPCQKDKLFDFTTRHSNPFTAIPRPPAYYNNSSSLSYSPTAKPNPPKAEESKPTYNLIDTLRDNIKIIQLTSFLYNPDTRRRHVNNSNELEMEDILPTASNVTGSINSSSLSPYQESYIKFKSLGLELVGGNKEGIFFKKINFTTPTPSPSDLTSITKLVPSPPLLPRCQGYQILEVNGKSTKNMTLEETIYEIGRSNEPSVSLTIHENLTKYQEILYKSCDLLYVRVLFDKEKVENIIENHHGRYGQTRFSDDNNFLNFKEGQIFLVDESVANNMCWGLWRAWKLDERGKKTECGLIPSMYSLQQRRQALFQNTCHKNNVKKTCEGRGNVLTSTTTSNSGEENDPFLQREIFGFVTNDKKLTVKTTPRTTNSYDDEEIYEIPWIKKNNNDYDAKIQCKSLTVGRKSRRFTTNIQKLFGPHKSFHWKQQHQQQVCQFTLPSNVSNFDASPSSHNTINHDDASHIGDVLSSPQLYQGLRKIEICYARPIVLLGHFTVEITEKLVEYWSHKFQKFEYEIMKGSGKLMEQGIREEVFFTYNKKTNNYYEYLSNQSILTLANQKKFHYILDVGKEVLPRFKTFRIYPIIITLNFNNSKDLKEFYEHNDMKSISSRFPEHKDNNYKKYKNVDKHKLIIFQDCIKEYKITGGASSLDIICEDLLHLVEQEQLKALWEPIETKNMVNNHSFGTL